MTVSGPPPEEERGTRWPLVAAIVVVVVALAAVVVAQMGGDEDADTTTTAAPTAPETTASTPPVTEGPTTTQSVETTVTTATTTTTPTTTATTEPPQAEIPAEAIGVSGADVVRVDTATGATEVLHPFVFEAASASKLSLADGTLYMHFVEEDYWFTCESAAGRVETLDLGSGATATLAPGVPALSPDGSTLAYLTAEGCYPDPDEPQFFLSVYDTLVLADPAGNEISRIPLSADSVEPPTALIDLVWEDESTVLVWSQDRTYYRVPTDATGPIDTLETVDLPAVDVFAVHDGMALAAEFSDTGWGPLQLVSLADGNSSPLGADVSDLYSVGMSPDGLAIVSAAEPPTLLVGVDLATGEIAATFDVPWLSGIDW